MAWVGTGNNKHDVLGSVGYGERSNVWVRGSKGAGEMKRFLETVNVMARRL